MATILGTTGNDTITYNTGTGHYFVNGVDQGAATSADSIDGGAGTNLNSGSDNINIAGTTGNNTVFVGHNAGFDTITLGSGSDSVIAAGEAASIAGGTHEVVNAGTGNSQYSTVDFQSGGYVKFNGDTIAGSSGADSVYAYGDAIGHDTFTAGINSDTIIGSQAGNDSVVIGTNYHGNYYVNASGTINDGGTGDDVLIVGAGNASVSNSTVSGGSFHDQIITYGHTNNVINTNAGSDTINTLTANDSITTGGGSNLIYDGTGTGNGGNETVNSSASGHDTISYAYANSGVNLSLTDTTGAATIGAAHDSITAAVNDQYVLSQAQNDTVTLSGTHSWNIASGGSGNDSFNASASSGNDTLTGGSGNDNIVGGTGNNTIDAMTGNNTITTHGNDLVYLGVSGNTQYTTTSTSNDTIDATHTGNNPVTIALNGTSGTVTDGSHVDTINAAAGGINHITIGSTTTITGTLNNGPLYINATGDNDVATAGASTWVFFDLGGGANNVHLTPSNTYDQAIYGTFFSQYDGDLTGSSTSNISNTGINSALQFNNVVVTANNQTASVNVNLATGANSLDDTITANSFNVLEGSNVGSNTLTGASAFSTTFIISPGGHDTINALYTDPSGNASHNSINLVNSGADTVDLSHDTASNFTLTGDFTDLEVSRSGNSQITFNGGGQVFVFGSNNVIYGGSVAANVNVGTQNFVLGNGGTTTNNNILVAGTGGHQDIFTFQSANTGADTIEGFVHGDQINVLSQFQSGITGGSDIQYVGADTKVTLAANTTIYVTGIHLTASDFIFS